jgi:hypothetical protein
MLALLAAAVMNFLPVAPLQYNATSACIHGKVYQNNVLPTNAGEFGTAGLNTSYWGGTHTKPFPSSWTGYQMSYGARHWFDTYFTEQADGLGLPEPRAIVTDTAAPGQPQALRLMAAPLPSHQKYAPGVVITPTGGWNVAHLTSGITLPAQGGTMTLHVDTPSPGGVSNGSRIGDGDTGYALWSATLSSGYGTSTWTMTDVQSYSPAGPGSTYNAGYTVNVIPNTAFVDYYAGIMDTNVQQQYFFMVARMRMPQWPLLPALWPVLWTQTDYGAPNQGLGTEQQELDIGEFMAGNPNQIHQAAGVYNLPVGQIQTPFDGNGYWTYGEQEMKPTTNPATDYHDYGVLVSPGSTTFYFDGVPTGAKWTNGPDGTQGSADNEIMLSFQMGFPGSWMDPTSTAIATNPWPQYFYTQWLRVYAPTATSC